VTKEQEVSMGKGRNFYTSAGEPSNPTKRVNDYICSEGEVLTYWKDQAARQRDAAANSREVRDGTHGINEIAARELAKQLRDEAVLRADRQKDRLQKDLLFGTLGEVNWQQLAEDLLQR
jgi:hypothetical protein